MSLTLSNELKANLQDMAATYREDFDKEEMYATAEKHGFNHIGSGSRREVFTHGDHPQVVFKIGCMDDARANRKEIETYEQFKDRTDALAPILAYAEDYRWLVMPRVSNEHSARREVLDKLREDGLRCKDTNHGNVGYLDDGSPVLFDYDWRCTER